jgi:hypothetical protein
VTYHKLSLDWVGTMGVDDVLVDDDVQEEEDVIGRHIKDIWDHSAREKSSDLQSGLNHCNHSLKSYCAKGKIK